MSIFERLYLVLGRRTFALSINCPCASTPPTAQSLAILPFCQSAQGWRNRTLVTHEPLVCNKLCFSKTEPVQYKSPMVQYLVNFIFKFNFGRDETKTYILSNLSKD